MLLVNKGLEIAKSRVVTTKITQSATTITVVTVCSSSCNTPIYSQPIR